MNPRYRWDGSDDRQLVELIDNITLMTVATIASDETGWWFWKRMTSRMIHGAPPTEGATNRGLMQAKREVLEGL